jgi:hypothetical protein
MDNIIEDTMLDELVSYDVTASSMELVSMLNKHLYPESNISWERIDGVKTETRCVILTPKLAETLLLRNTNNRPISQLNVTKITKAITNGEWNNDGNAIIFDLNGVLLNGAHRLTSVVKADKPIVIKIGTGYLPEVFTTMDVGKTRTGSDVLAIAGFENYRLCSTTANFLFKLYRGSVAEVGSNTTATQQLSHPELIKFIEEKPRLRESIKFYLNNKKKQDTKIVYNYIICGLHYLFSGKDKDMADEFIISLLSGNELNDRSPIKAVRTRLLNSSRDRYQSISHGDSIKLIITGWNKFRNGELCKHIQIPEKLPVII